MEEKINENNNINEATDIKINESKQPEPDEFQKCQKDREEYLNGWKRALADFSNYKKDENKRRAEIIKFANEEILFDLLQILDSFNLALAVIPASESENKIKRGIEMIKMQFTEISKKYGLEEISAQGGSASDGKTKEEKFDPIYHEAIAEEKSDKEPGTIIETISKGYLLNGKVIRAAKVKVAQ